MAQPSAEEVVALLRSVHEITAETQSEPINESIPSSSMVFAGQDDSNLDGCFSAANLTWSVSAICPYVPSVTHRGKPPALPGDSPRFDLYDGLREFLISAKRKEIHNERVPEPEPYVVARIDHRKRIQRQGFSLWPVGSAFPFQRIGLDFANFVHNSGRGAVRATNCRQ